MLSGRAIALLISGTAGLMLLAVSFLVPKDLRLVVGASGLVAGASGAVAAVSWRKPRPQAVKDAIARTRDTLLSEAEQEIQAQLKPAPWTLNAVDVDATYQVSEPANATHSPLVSEVSNPVSELVSEPESLFNFDLENPWETTSLLTEESEPARY